MNMKKRLIAAGVAAALATVALAGCSNADKAEGGEKGEVTLTYGVWAQEDVMQQLIDAFEAKNEGIKVEMQVNPWQEYWTKLQVAAQGGTAPDAFWMLADHFQVYAANDQLMPLDDEISKAGVDMSNYPKALVDMFNYEGHQYGLPKDFDTIGLFYNKDLFDAAGVEYPNENWTWDDVKAAAAKLTDKDKGVYGIAAPIDRQQGHYNTIPQAGGSVISDDKKISGYDDPKTQAGLQYWVDFIKNGQSPTLQQMADTEPVAMFENEMIAMYYGGSYFVQRYYDNEALRAKIDVTVLPKGEKRATVINGIQNVGFANSKHKPELAKFLLFLGSEEAAKIQAASGAVIPAYNGTQQAWVDSMPELNLQHSWTRPSTRFRSRSPGTLRCGKSSRAPI
jgi:multiple sugar transport system substrate-binding protein